MSAACAAAAGQPAAAVAPAAADAARNVRRLSEGVVSDMGLPFVRARRCPAAQHGVPGVQPVTGERAAVAVPGGRG
ncbi:hypothetical protein Cme02nite_56320 [Catellatospora methionotrophica]|uniref:Uncharacterized protein n=1 Tax=Catellatospora methionotrophica TaxID=121620 RepID=A0A8J3LFA1_9ACTN|nr:hypothetical protein Cme02nite_56320 [Catellatospora methionotrophica]